MNSVLQFKKVNCKNCYKCVRHCPVKSIEVSGHQAQIIERDCILCGNCTIVCPQHAKMDISDVSKIKEIIRSGKTVIASVAPSFIAYYDVHNFSHLCNALKELHFTDAFETAEGAYLVKSEYEKIIQQNKISTIISSCCSTINQYIRKHRPEVLPNLAPVITPMQAHAKLIKERYPDAVVVFIGPCVSKKAECQEKGSDVDFVVTFGELKEWLNENNIVLSKNDIKTTEEKYLSRLFPVSGGILNTMKKSSNYKYISICGIDNCIKAIEDVANGSLPNCFIEMSACEGSCSGGPSFRKHNMSVINSQFAVEEISPEKCEFETDYNIDNSNITLDTMFTDQKTYYMNPNEKQIAGILRKMGKNSVEDELNCGMCGYSSCREKAIAVYFGKADISMCLPFMKERAESFSDKIINVTPNAIIAVDMDLKVQQINKSACDIFGIMEQNDILGQPVSRILDEFDFVDMITNDTTRQTKRSFLAEYNVYLEQIFLYDKSNSIIICIMKNITKDKQKQNQVMKAKLHAANMADDIVEKQLRTVHEIASLLGETAAETKVAITELKETIMMDNDDLK